MSQLRPHVVFIPKKKLFVRQLHWFPSDISFFPFLGVLNPILGCFVTMNHYSPLWIPWLSHSIAIAAIAIQRLEPVTQLWLFVVPLVDLPHCYLQDLEPGSSQNCSQAKGEAQAVFGAWRDSLVLSPSGNPKTTMKPQNTIPYGTKDLLDQNVGIRLIN